MCQSFEEECFDDPDGECGNGCCCCCCFGGNGCQCCKDENGNCNCPPECCRRLYHCCNPMRCFTYSNTIAFLRSLFLMLHTLLIATSIFGLIWANVYFDDFDQVFTGSIIGGHLVTLSAGGLIFGLSGLYAAIKRHRRLLYTHMVVCWIIFFLRGFTWLLSMLHDHKLDPLIYGLAPLEFLLAILGTMLLRDALIYY